jgi:hypothetical protein
MVNLSNPIQISYKSKSYVILQSTYKSQRIPILIDAETFAYIKSSLTGWTLHSTGFLSKKININGESKNIFLHEIPMMIFEKKLKPIPILHQNKISIDNRYSNLLYDDTDKDQTKNLNKKSRIIDLTESNIDAEDIPTFIWYINPDSSHGERFQVEIGPCRWKTCSSKKYCLRYKLEEAKKFLRHIKLTRPDFFCSYSMNGDLNKVGLDKKKEFYEIIKLGGFEYESNFDDDSKNSTECLKEDLSGLSTVEIELLKDLKFNI